MEFNEGPFLRPHPAFWKAVLAIEIAYEICLVILLFQSKDIARHLLTYLDPSLGIPLPEKSYGEQCDFTFSNVYNGIDIFVIAHILGWVAKSLLLRDVWLCWIVSVMFEVMEYSLEHQLPNFAECWFSSCNFRWDHWILDVFTSNWLGIIIGMSLCRYFSMKKYSWRTIRQIKTVKGKLQRTAQQFTPHSWTSFDWAQTKSFKGYVSVIIIITIVF